MKLSPISIMHYLKLVGRSAMFLLAAVLYIIGKVQHGEMFAGFEHGFLPLVYTLIFAAEMLLRLFPSKLESMGCQKHFKQNYVPRCQVAKKELRLRGLKKITPVIIFWVTLNAIIFALYFAGIIDWGILILVSLAYSICDMICILFFCPFQTWMMKNKCCGSCRIYNWDYAMMFTPLLFIPSLYTWSLLGLALVLLVIWEGIYRRHPERFYEQCNENLACVNCQEKLCHHKKQLRSVLIKRKIELSEELKKHGFDRK